MSLSKPGYFRRVVTFRKKPLFKSQTAFDRLRLTHFEELKIISTSFSLLNLWNFGPINRNLSEVVEIVADRFISYHYHNVNYIGLIVSSFK